MITMSDGSFVRRWVVNNRRTIGPDDICELVKSVHRNELARGSVVLCLVGPPGIGKTQQVARACEELGVRQVTKILSQCLPTEVCGMAMPDDEANVIRTYDPEDLASMEDGDVLVLDELTTAPPSVMKACLTMIQDRKLMSGRKMKDVMIVAMCNRPASYKMIPYPVRQRFLWTKVNVNRDDVYEYFRRKYLLELDDNVIKKLTFDEDDGSDYNDLTPRTVEKLVKWVVGMRSDDDFDVAVKALNSVGELFYLGCSGFSDITCSLTRKLMKPAQALLTATAVKHPDMPFWKRQKLLMLKDSSPKHVLEELRNLFGDEEAERIAASVTKVDASEHDDEKS